MTGVLNTLSSSSAKAANSRILSGVAGRIRILTFLFSGLLTNNQIWWSEERKERKSRRAKGWKVGVEAGVRPVHRLWGRLSLGIASCGGGDENKVKEWCLRRSKMKRKEKNEK